MADMGACVLDRQPLHAPRCSPTHTYTSCCLPASLSLSLSLRVQVYPKVAPVLVQRFREREETVKQDVFQVRRSGVGSLRKPGSSASAARCLGALVA
jgi:hypothetical protein